MDHTETSATINSAEAIGRVSKKLDLNPAVKIILDLILTIVVYLVFYYLKKSSFIYDENYFLFLPVFAAAWAIGGFLSGKFRIKKEHIFFVRVKRHYTALLISLGTIAIFLLETNYSISRFVVVGSFIVSFIAEVVIEFYLTGSKIEKPDSDRGPVSYLFLILDFLLLSWIIFFLYEIKIGFANLDENQAMLIAATYCSWLFAALITHQFKPFTKKFNFWKAMGLQVKFYILLIALISVIVYLLQLPDLYRSLFLTSVVLYSFWSLILTGYLYLDKVPQKTDDIKSDFLKAYELQIPETKEKKEIPDTRYRFVNKLSGSTELKTRLEYVYFKQFPEIFDFLERKLDLSTFDTNRTYVLRSRDLYNVQVLPEEEIELFINLHQLNDIRRLNQYFIEVNKRLQKGGVFVGRFEPIKYRYKRFLKKYPFIIANLFYLIDFIWHRVTPKIPVVRKLFFTFTKGKNRALSLAEGLGRLYYCGFEVLDLKDVDDVCNFVAKKIKEPSTDKNPSYSPIFKMRRIGKNNKEIFVYKLRTMHPYSEYLQEFVYQQNKLDEGGKFRNDFRITTWGAVFRKLWIDELPMLINWLRGDCKLVGIRPISRHYLSLYDEDFRSKRLSYKPGLVPPYYADMPKTLKEIIESEKRYLASYDKNRFTTDLKYFWKAFNNIVLKKKRSA